MRSAREAAVKVLMKICRAQAYSNLALDAMQEQLSLSAAATAFLTALVYTAVERLYTIDYNLSKRLQQPLSKLRPEVLAVLRVGAAQILFMDKVPTSAAVNESVKLGEFRLGAF